MGLRLLLVLNNIVDQQVFVSGTWEMGTIDTLSGWHGKCGSVGSGSKASLFLNRGARKQRRQT
jgi:hypothetical protein